MHARYPVWWRRAGAATRTDLRGSRRFAPLLLRSHLSSGEHGGVASSMRDPRPAISVSRTHRSLGWQWNGRSPATGRGACSSSPTSRAFARFGRWRRAIHGESTGGGHSTSCGLHDFSTWWGPAPRGVARSDPLARGGVTGGAAQRSLWRAVRRGSIRSRQDMVVESSHAVVSIHRQRRIPGICPSRSNRRAMCCWRSSDLGANFAVMGRLRRGARARRRED